MELKPFIRRYFLPDLRICYILRRIFTESCRELATGRRSITVRAVRASAPAQHPRLSTAYPSRQNSRRRKRYAWYPEHRLTVTTVENEEHAPFSLTYDIPYPVVYYAGIITAYEFIAAVCFKRVGRRLASTVPAEIYNRKVRLHSLLHGGDYC